MRTLALLPIAALLGLLSLASSTSQGASKLSDWTVTGFSLLENRQRYDCKKVAGIDDAAIIEFGNYGEVGFRQSGNACLGKDVSYLEMGFYFSFVKGAFGDDLRPQAVSVSLYQTETIVDTSALEDADEYLATQEGFQERGIQGYLSSMDRYGHHLVHFGRMISANEYPLTCRTFVSTIFNMRNPFGKRTMECTGCTAAGKINISFQDRAY